MNEHPERQEIAPAFKDQEESMPALVLSPETILDAGHSVLPFPIVGIGASAGGLEAYVQLLSALAPDTGMAFVLVSHLSPQHESHLAEILARHTRMPLREIGQGDKPEPNHVYVMPRGTRLLLSHGTFLLETRGLSERNSLPIDYFFNSLAAHQKNRAMGIVLSGMDSDGALGLKAIKGEGGIAIVQTPESALFSQMPRSGIAVDHVDLVLPPAEIALELARLAKQFDHPGLLPLEQGDLPPGEAVHFARIFALLRGVANIDFRLYKPTTVQRRTARRMLLNRIDALADYVQMLQSDPEELANLQEDILINVTHFFRDSEVFDAIKQDLFPALFNGRSQSEPVRVWVAGCSTGEEVYSMAMLLLEFFNNQIEPHIQIFGTDASEQSVEKARHGNYPESISSEVSPERLRRFFSKVEHGYQISKRVRDLCVFARQNLCEDPPFSRLDLISCRNVLIYLGTGVQKNIVQMFNYALRSGGYLVLGSSESIREHSDLFAPVDRKHKFYQQIGSLAPAAGLVTRAFRPVGTLYTPTARANTRDSWNEVELQRAADRIILARYGPSGVVINDKLEVLQVRGHTGHFLEHSPGAPSFNLLRMAKNGLAPHLRDAVHRAISENVPVKVEGIRPYDSGAIHNLTIEVLPIQGTAQHAASYLVLFIPVPAPPPTAEPPGAPAIPQDEVQLDMARMREDLASTRIYLQSLIEERDNRNQELTSAYEEVQSSHEELQSSTEELETAKEELQSTNEELQTVNEELRNRNTELQQASNDLLNLLNSVNIPVLILDNSLIIRHFTPPAERFMHVRASDIGRRIGEIRLNLDEGDLEPILQEVLDTLGARELEVQDRQGRWHILRIRPYRTAENRIEGLVLILMDIDQVRRGERAVREARDMAQAVIECVIVPLAVLNSDLEVLVTNAAFRELAGLEQPSLSNRSFPELITLLWRMDGVVQSLKTLTEKGATFDEEHLVPGPNPRVFHINGTLVHLDGGNTMLVTIEDITDRKHSQELAEQEHRRLHAEVSLAHEQLERTRGELRALTGSLFLSQEAERRRVARELHDDIGQRVAMLANGAEQLREHLTDAPPASRELLETLRLQAAELSDDLRRISHALHPSILEDLGLPSALRSLVTEFAEREGMPADFTHRAVPQNLSVEVASTLYRITQEALRNVSKHAGRTHVRVSLIGGKAGLRLTVRDLGEGFDPSDIRGLGLISMEERARLIGGAFSIASAIGEGTSVQVQVPLETPPPPQPDD